MDLHTGPYQSKKWATGRNASDATLFLYSFTTPEEFCVGEKSDFIREISTPDLVLRAECNRNKHQLFPLPRFHPKQNFYPTEKMLFSGQF
jgi:hypothetical protein